MKTSVARFVFVLLGFALFLGGLATLKGGGIAYPNYWGGPVFAPFAIVVGVAFIAYPIVRWKTFLQPDKPKKLKGRAARKARKAAQIKFPVETYRKW